MSVQIYFYKIVRLKLNIMAKEEFKLSNFSGFVYTLICRMLTKRTILLILLCLPTLGFGQGSIISLTVSPAYPSETDTVYIYAALSFSYSSCPLDLKSYSISGNNIIASTQHCIGLLAAICYNTDTFKINPLAAGTYSFSLTLSSGFGSSGPPCTPGIVPDDYDTITFNVSTSVGVEEHTTNKELLRVIDIFGREVNEIGYTPLFYIYNDGTVERKIILE